MVPRLGPLKLKAQIFCGDEPAIGPGKADLLEAIDAEGSIFGGRPRAGNELSAHMASRRQHESLLGERLVETTPGGGNARGARITPFGKRVLAAYRALERSMLAAADEELSSLAALLRDRPLPPA